MNFIKSILYPLALLAPLNASSQTIIQHIGAADPLAEGFSTSEFTDPQLGPVFDDLGFDAWSFDTRLGGSGSYYYQLSTEQQEAAATNGWVLSTRMRMVSPGAGGNLQFGPEIESFRLRLELTSGGDIIVRNGVTEVYRFEGGGSNYHEYSLIYDALDETAALWITGIGQVAEFSGSGSLPEGRVYFGMTSPGHVHWNEVSLTIIPEPATVALLTAMGSLLSVAGIRWRKRRLTR